MAAKAASARAARTSFPDDPWCQIQRHRNAPTEVPKDGKVIHRIFVEGTAWLTSMSTM